METVAWTDGRDVQEKFAEAVKRWCEFHDNLHDKNSKKITKSNRGIVLLSHLYGIAGDVRKLIDDDNINSLDEFLAIVNAIHKRDPPTVVSSFCSELITLHNKNISHGESFRNFESRFNAQLSGFNSNAANTALSDARYALVLFSNANVDANQRVAILAAA